MALERMEYSDARSMMKPGDVIAFGGKGHFSELIKFTTRADVSHVGVILQTRVVDDKTGRFFNQIIESTSTNDFNGVVISRLSDRMDTYEGRYGGCLLMTGSAKRSSIRSASITFSSTKLGIAKGMMYPKLSNRPLMPWMSCLSASTAPDTTVKISVGFSARNWWLRAWKKPAPSVR